MGAHAKIPFNCVQCNTEFMATLYRRKRGQSRFCSKACFLNSVKNKVLRVCKHCRKEFEVNKHKTLTGRGIFCKKSCYSSWCVGKSPWNKGKKLPSTTGINNPNWKGKILKQHGYVMVRLPDHPNNIGGYIYEHRLVMEKQLGRFLKSEEVVHHINSNREDNRIENLMVFSSHSDHRKHHSR